MQVLSAIPPALPGGLLTWSLAAVFGSVFLVVLGVFHGLRPVTAFHRLDSLKPEPGAGLRSGAPPGASAKLRRILGSPIAQAILVVLPLFLGLGWSVKLGALSWVQALYAAGVLAVLAWAVPARLRAWRASRRREALRRGFPDALDMMVVCVEAGLGLDAALNRVAVEIAQAQPPIAAELTQIGRELRAGRERGTVLRNFAHRAGLPEVASFATLLIQSEALGTGVARSLRVQAEDMRASRMLRAEEQAHTLPVKLTIPLVFCILPAMIVVVLLPSALAIWRDILPHLGG